MFKYTHYFMCNNTVATGQAAYIKLHNNKLDQLYDHYLTLTEDAAQRVAGRKYFDHAQFVIAQNSSVHKVNAQSAQNCAVPYALTALFDQQLNAAH